jgi:hypothetical protein
MKNLPCAPARKADSFDLPCTTLPHFRIDAHNPAPRITFRKQNVCAAAFQRRAPSRLKRSLPGRGSFARDQLRAVFMLPALWSRTSLGNPCAGDRATSLLGGCAAGNSSNCLCRDAIGGNFVKARTCLYFRQGGWLQVGTAPGAGSRRALPFNAVVPIAAKTAPVRFGARAPIHSGRAVRTRRHRN